MATRKTESIIKYCNKHGYTEYAVISTTGKTYCRKCKAEQSKEKRHKLKLKCIEYLGNKCLKCNQIYNENLYDFHFIKNKYFSISNLILKNNSFEKLKSELDKCILLCGNCYAEFLYEKYNEDKIQEIKTYYIQQKRHEIKLKAIEYLGGKCKICGYNKCKDALVFHHRNSEEIEFEIGGNGKIHKWNNIIKELDKCDLLCINCHRNIHFGANMALTAK